MDPGELARVKESPQQATLARARHPETHQEHSRADHPHVHNRRADDRQGKTVADVCRVIELTQPTDHRWREQCGGMQSEEARRLSQLEKLTTRLWPKAFAQQLVLAEGNS
jgi:hypothetical protein